jgi:hypothetical protein
MRYILYFPLLGLTFIAYNIGMSAGVDFSANPTMLHIPHLTRETPTTVGAADLLVGVAIVLLYFEILKAARISRTTIIDHMLSMFVFIAFLIELIVAAGAGTATFMLLTLIALIDVIAGFTISIATARRDFAIGGDGIG